MNERESIEKLAEEFEESRKLLTALGDESRQHIILTMMKMGDCDRGIRVIEIAEKTNLSRPAASHHLQIMKDAGLVKSRKEGTKIYYYFDPDSKTMNALMDALHLTKKITGELRERRVEE